MSATGGDRNANTISASAYCLRDNDDILEVTPEGLIQKDSDDALTADFRYRIGLLPEEEEGLTEVFKASIGLSGPEPLAGVSELDLKVEKQYEATLKGFKFDKFAKKHFPGGETGVFSKEPLREPLLHKKHDVDRMASRSIWLAIQRFMGDIPSPDVTSAERSRVPIMTKLFKTIELQSKRKSSTTSQDQDDGEFVSLKLREKGSEKNSEKRKSWRKVFSRSQSSGSSEKRLSRSGSTSSNGSGDVKENGSMNDSIHSIPTEEIDLIHYIVGYGILRKELRDEIYCQLCKQIRHNPSRDGTLKGWILLALCGGCFMPSEQFHNYVQSALREVGPDLKDYSIYTRRIMKRTAANGQRYHPPNWLEYQATKMRKYVMLPVALPDGRMQSVEADSAITSGEVTAKIASEINLKDSFGFSTFICIMDKVSSLGCGMDHVMDAISECEQLMRSKGKKEEDAPWRLYFRKEMFVPWHNPEHCAVSSDLIYRQIVKGIKTEEYRTRMEDELVRFAARKWYIDNGSELIPGKLQNELHQFLPKSALTGGKSREGWVQAIMASFTEQGFDKECVPKEQVKWHIVVSSPNKWPLQFAGLFEAFKIAGPRLPRNDIVIAVCGRGVFFLDEPYRVVTSFKFYEIVEVFCSRAGKTHGQTLNLVTIKGDEFTFISPNAETITRVVTTFLDGLRQRSRVAVALQEFIFEDAGKKSTFAFTQGDVIDILDDKPSKEDWLVGRLDSSGQSGEFPIDVVYILPTVEKPPAAFLELFTLMSASNASTLPRKRGAVRLDAASKESAAGNGQDLESAA